jgi:hypothetical protein
VEREDVEVVVGDLERKGVSEGREETEDVREDVIVFVATVD